MSGATTRKAPRPRPTCQDGCAEVLRAGQGDGEVFNRGDCAYVIGDKTRDLDDDELEPCGACGECGVEDDVMLECDACSGLAHAMPASAAGRSSGG